MLMAILLLVLTNLQHPQNKIIARFNNQCAICIDALEHLDKQILYEPSPETAEVFVLSAHRKEDLIIWGSVITLLWRVAIRIVIRLKFMTGNDIMV